MLGACSLPAVVSLAAFWRRHDQPWLLAGWASVFGYAAAGDWSWCKTGFQSIADRYAYLPSIGLFIAVVWGLAELAGRPAPEPRSSRPAAPERQRGEREEANPFLRSPISALPSPFPASSPRLPQGDEPSNARRSGPSTINYQLSTAFLVALGAACVLACGLDTRYQLGYWRDSRVLLNQHALDVSPKDNFLGYYYLGTSFGKAGQLEAAAGCLAASLKIKPDFEPTRRQMGTVLLMQKKYAAARPYLEQTASNHPDNFMARLSLGEALAGQGSWLAAQSEFQAALQLRPDAAQVKELLAVVAPKADAEQTLNELAGRLATNAAPELHARAALAQSVLGRYADAVKQYRLALAQRPDSVEWLNNLAWLLATCPEDAVRDGAGAVALAQHACDLTQSKTTVCLGTLAAACAEAGRFDDAVLNAKKACDNAVAQGETGLLELNQKLLALYQNHQTYHEIPSGSAVR